MNAPFSRRLVLKAGAAAGGVLKYVVSHPAVTCALPGTTQRKHLDNDLRAARGRLPDAALRESMEKYWDSNI
jgi:aryl-alcohol dehydrogenase-like predicted oxidoreductase